MKNVSTLYAERRQLLNATAEKAATTAASTAINAAAAAATTSTPFYASFDTSTAPTATWTAPERISTDAQCNCTPWWVSVLATIAVFIIICLVQKCE